MNNLTPYQEKAINYKNHISVVANAGSGKTFVLANRFIEIYLNEEVDISEIVAITFTDKASGELKRKISNQIAERIREENNFQKKKKLIQLQSELVEANISTIHSFCKNLLNEYSVEAEIDVSSILIDEQKSQELKEIVVEETIQKLLNEDNNHLTIKKLIRLFGSKSNLRNELINALEKRKIIEQLNNSFYNKDIEKIVEWFDNNYQKYFNKYFEPLITKFIESIKIVNDKVLSQSKKSDIALEIDRYLNEDLYSTEPKINFIKSIREILFTKNKPIKLRSKGYYNYKDDEIVEVDFINQNISKVFSAIEYYGKKDLHKLLAEYGLLTIKVLNEIITNYNHKKKQKGFLDFEDLLLLSKKILQSKEVQQSLQNKYKFIMIDEYQDTNEIQYEIVMPILEDLKKGNLFVVGDEKQSIYAFRDAELEIFEKTKKKITIENENGLLFLPHSFRMQPKLILFINKLFKKLFENPESDFNEVQYNNLISTKEDVSKGKVGILLAEKEKNISEAFLVVKKIKEIIYHNSEYSFKDFAILCRKRNSFENIENELVKNNIPFTIVGGKGFYQQQTIYDIYNYLSFLLNPKDDAALIGVLRSPFFNLSDLEIYKISLIKEKTFYEKLKYYSIHSNINLINIVDGLERNIKNAKSNSPADIIRTILVESGYWTYVSEKEDSEQEIANLEKLISIACDFINQPFKNLYDFVVNLKSLIENDENEGQAPISEDQNTIKIMTIHQSKGLEFPIVFLFDSNSNTVKNLIKEKSLYIDKTFGIITKIPVKNYFENYSQPPIGNIYEYIITNKDLAELKRLLYVALTRAKEELYISATIKNLEANPQKNSFFDLINNVFGILKKNEVKFSDNIQVMLKEKNYEIKTELCEIKISVEKDILDYELINENIEQKHFQKIYLNKIEDKPSNEIISATKIAIYNQCPVKYQLTYEFGYQPILDIIKNEEDKYEYQPNEETEIKGESKIRGRIIHKILSSEKKLSNYKTFLLEETKREKIFNEKFIYSIKEDLEMFLNSSTYKETTSFKDYKNEFEVYSKQNDYILYGIIDKIIFNNDEIIIIDYKTDNVSIEEIPQRAKDYFSQLMFYAIILKNLYPQTKKYLLQLIFIKHPDEKIIKKITNDDLNNYENEVYNSIQNIYNQNFIPKLNHCIKCHYFIEGKLCVKEIKY
ncbi:MAG: UvrD-helicase domain-containing protein [Melioribacteraceae bacterium]|nr:UvrD-helicase domain-containing protein [Melioribacteraceae bacterium]